MNSCELTASITAIANAIACNLSDDDLSVFAAILTQLGDTLATISTYRSICGNHSDPQPCSSAQQASDKTPNAADDKKE